MADIIKEMMEMLPKDKISDACFEGANIMFYTKDKEFLLDNSGIVKDIVSKFKKRVELRPDPSITMPKDEATEIIRKIIPEEALVGQIIFDTERSQVIIETEKPGLAIGKQGSILREIKERTFWVPLIKRTPVLRSQIIEDIRAVLYQHSDYRRKFLNKVGHRIYDGWQRGKHNEWIRLTYMGGARQVGRSCLFLQTPESRILMDCGIDPTQNAQSYPYLESPEFRIDELDAIILSHAHIDHSGFIPYLFKYGFRGPVYCTAPTRDITALLLLDMIKIAKNEGKEPLYTADDVKEMVKHTICLDFEEVSDVTPDVRLTFYNSGHILGSAMIHLHIGNGLHNMLYTADMKYGKTHLMEAAHTRFPRLETLMIESTYGGRDNNLPPEIEADQLLIKIIKETVARRGKILMPTLGSGRSQEVQILIYNLIKAGELEEIPVYIDGMVWDITAIHTAYPEFLNSKIRKQIFHKDDNPFVAPFFKRVGSAKERQQIWEETGPCVIMATSGMLIGGPSVEYLRHLADNPRNSLVFSCYQAEGSLGSRIKKGEREITYTEGQKTEVVPIKMEVNTLEISAHSDRKQLMNFVSRCDPRPKKVIVNHGENSRILDLASSIHKQFRIETVAPRNMEVVRLR